MEMDMHWTDPFNDINKTAPQYAKAGLELIRLLRSEGWKPEEIEMLAGPTLVDIRAALLTTLRAPK